MAWIRDGQVYEIIRAFSLQSTQRKLKDHLNRGWKQHGEIREHGNGYACLVSKSVKGQMDHGKKEQVFCKKSNNRRNTV